MSLLPASDPWIGRCVGDRYRLQERLGGGSMGDVFLALDSRIGQIVAIKILKSHWAETEELRRRFEHEVTLCAALKSEHVVRVSDYGVTPDGYLYYVMEYLTGQTLGDLMRQSGQVPIHKAVDFIKQVCDGLERAHSGIMLPNRGEMIKVVHRDLKPDNIFIVESSLGPLIKILDFGIAKIQNSQRDSTMATNMFIGTFHYASPEQIEVRQELDGRSDIYSLGIILYEMLSGVDPFGLSNSKNAEISQMTWAIAHASRPVIPIRSQVGCNGISPRLESIVMRCLEKNPEDRFETVQELRQALIEAMRTKADTAVDHPSAETIVGQIEQTWVQPALSQPNSGATLAESAVQPVAETQFTLPPLIPNDTSQLRAKPPQRSPLLFLVLGFTTAVGISGVVLWQLLQKQPPLPPTLTTPTPSQPAVDWLAQANQQAVSGDLAGAIAAAQKIPTDSPDTYAAQQKIEDWSRQILTTADNNLRQKVNTAQALSQAILQVQAIPSTAGEIYAEAQAMVERWKADWSNAEATINKAKQASEAGQWEAVLAATKNLPQIYYWQMQATTLNEKAKVEIERSAPVVNAPAPAPVPSPPRSPQQARPKSPSAPPPRPSVSAPQPRPPVSAPAPSASPPIYEIPSDSAL